MPVVFPGQAFALARQSRILGTLTVVDRTAGEILVPPRQVVGMSLQLWLGGVDGAVTSPSAEKDCSQALRRFAASIHRQL